MTEAPAPDAPVAWYIQAADRVWGPYPEARLASFLAERRLTAQSLVATQAAGPFGPAGRRRELTSLFDPAAGGDPAAQASQAAGPGTAALKTASQPAAAGPRALLVWAHLASLPPEAFEAALSGCGVFAAIRPGLWMVQAPLSASGLRNALSRALDGRDTLIVVQAPLEHAAWFNLDQSAERSLRTLWSGAGV